MRRKKISDHTGKPSRSGREDDLDIKNMKSEAKEEVWDKGKNEPCEMPLLNENDFLSKKAKTKIEVTASSNLDPRHSCENVLVDGIDEWASDGDHLKALITLSFERQKINKILIADRASEEASMINGIIEIHGGIQAGGNIELLNSISFDGLPGNGEKIEVNVGGIFVSKIVVKAGDKVWGKNIGLRYLNFE